MKSKLKRKVLLLVIGVEPDLALNQALESHNWLVHPAYSFATAKQLLEAVPFNVGIILLSENVGVQQLSELEAMLGCDSYINWVLVLPEGHQPDTETAEKLQAIISEYCFDYHHGPVQTEIILSILGHGYGMADMVRNPLIINTQSYSQFGIIGNSPPMQQLYRNITKVCTLDDPVLISGETGTGKELVANAIHYHSARADAHFVAINCGSLADSLVQAELFGYEKGAFTGAHKRKIGRIEASDGGTLFLDEVGDLPLCQQANLLRFLQEKTIVRVGGHEEVPVDVRIIAATNVDLKQAVAEGRFRDDLFYRLNVLHLNVPSLRERGEDIELLCRYFLHSKPYGHRTRAKGLSAAALHLVNNYEWKGNVRELGNSIKHAQIMSENRLITPEDLDLERRHGQRYFGTLEQMREDAERSAIQGSLRQCKNNISQAAHVLGVSRVTLHRLINKYHLHANQ